VKNPDRPPRVGLKLALRALLACILVMVLTGTAVATVALRELDDILDPIRRDGRADIDVPELDVPDPGGPRTFMVLGSDAREGADAGMSPRSDTILLARADPDKDAIAVMSIPRDLKVEIPGHGKGKINSAFELGGKKGGPRLAVRTVKKLFEDATGERFPITNVMIMDYGAFRRAVNYIDGVYVDVDRDYFNDNSSGENYATIDINPGYQLLKGKDALDYVRYRHTDNDLVRAARQQDFLRQAKNAAGVRKLLAGGLSETKHLVQVFSRYFRVDKSLRSNKQILSMLKLVLYLSSENPKVHEVAFKVSDAPNPQLDSNLYSRDSDLRRAYREFMQVKESATPRESSTEAAAAEPDRQVGRERERRRARRSRNPRQTDVAGLEDATREGEDQAVIADPKLKLPFYFPTKRVAGSVYSGTEPRIYKLKDERGNKREAYRLVLSRQRIGEYYGVQGLAWKAPPILDDPDRTIRRGNRRFRLYYDGERLRLVAWRTKRGVYWISNTLTQSIGEDQMIAIAASLKRLKQ
jgi:polyisoprenyl-teichoic acid--peptidoglycan teichoic acid transferase